MITFSSLLLKGFFDENKDFLTSSKVQKIQQPSRRELLIQLRNQAITKKLYININPDSFHICFLNDETYKLRNIKIPKEPPMFCMLLRKYIENARVKSVNVPKYERIFELYFENYNEIGEKIELCLAIELMGKYSNVILYNTDNNIILGCMHNVGEEKSQIRELSGGLPYIYPPKKNKKDLLNITENEFNILKPITQNMFFYVSGQILQDSKEDYKNLYETIKKSKIYMNKDEYSFFKKDESFIEADFNSAIDYYYSKNQSENLLKSLKSNLSNSINKKIKKQQKTIEKIEQENIKNKAFEKYKLYGDLIFANIYKIKNGDKELIATNFETNKDIKIPLDKNLSPSQNAQKYYKNYSKTKTTMEYSSKRLQDAKEELKDLLEIELSIELSNNFDELNALKKDLSIQKQNKKDKKEITIEKSEINGFTFYIGRNHFQNDYLLSKISQPDDIWIHLKDMPSAHVIIKQQEKEIDEITIFEGAKIVKELSKAKNSSKVVVIYTKKKFVKKIPKSKYGLVNYREEKEIVLD